MYQAILEKIKRSDKISIFRHQRPDGDAMFSALALYRFLKDNFPEKDIRVAGEDKYDLISKNDRISLKFIKESLAFVLDTSTSDRIDDVRALKASCIIKIDHHPIDAPYGQINLVDTKASACAEVLAEMFLSEEFRPFKLSEKTCEYLYSGIVTDTINFRTTNVTADTLNAASRLVAEGDLKVAEIVEFLMDKNIDDYQKTTKIRTRLKIKGHFGYIIFMQNDLDKLGMDQLQAKNNIDEIGRIKDLRIWSIATQQDGLYDVSVRSKRGLAINEVCAAYGGGGHKNAAACKKLSRKQLKTMYATLYEMSEKDVVSMK
ncbi:MAG: bifunctional oligoribonuclease/PAP phosphatase NrnA [Erysipelotrichaceae bacterium]|nr:bifunctional oligoribonuclease/PAP phosphatase NrnA [Erysipelotrichaceae bacterium]